MGTASLFILYRRNSSICFCVRRCFLSIQGLKNYWYDAFNSIEEVSRMRWHFKDGVGISKIFQYHKKIGMRMVHKSQKIQLSNYGLHSTHIIGWTWRNLKALLDVTFSPSDLHGNWNYHNEKDGGMYILPECITNIKSKWLNKDETKPPNDEKF